MLVFYRARSGAWPADREQLLSRSHAPTSWKFGVGAAASPSHQKGELHGKSFCSWRNFPGGAPAAPRVTPLGSPLSLHISLPAAGRARVSPRGNPLIRAPYKTGDNSGSFLGGAGWLRAPLGRRNFPRMPAAAGMGSPPSAPWLSRTAGGTRPGFPPFWPPRRTNNPTSFTRGSKRAGASSADIWFCKWLSRASWKGFDPFLVGLRAPKVHC